MSKNQFVQMASAQIQWPYDSLILDKFLLGLILSVVVAYSI
jgi:hypothetical protein